MTKKEIIWRYLAHEAFSHKKYQFTQKELAERFGFSLSTVNNALRAPRQAGAVKVTGRYFLVSDKEKFLYLWATHRSLSKATVYATVAPISPRKIENAMPPGVVFTAYSGYVLQFREAPADYDRVHVYANSQDLERIKKQFPPSKNGRQNLFVFQSDEWLESLSPVGAAPAEQLFADIWNLDDWYAKDFLKSLKERMEF